MSADLVAQVRFSLEPDAGRDYRLPGVGSRSMLFVFDGQQVGGQAQSDKDFTPASTHDGVTLTFWDEAARALVTPGAAFDVWYGETIGHGLVESVGWATSG